MHSITPWNPFRELEAMQERVLRAMNPATRRAESDRQSVTTADWAPPVDISEDEGGYLIKAELPEVGKEDITVTVENGVLTIKGERRFEEEQSGRHFHRVERRYGSFLRSFTMPEETDPEQVSAEFKDGVLHVHLVKSEVKKPKSIDIKVG